MVEFPTLLLQGLPKLTSLDLSFNFIEEMSEEAYNTSSLTSLDVSYNLLTEAPKPLSLSLQIRDEGNPLSLSPNNQFLSAAINDYYQVLRQEMSEFPSEFNWRGHVAFNRFIESINALYQMYKENSLYQLYSETRSSYSVEVGQIKKLMKRVCNLLIEMVRVSSIRDLIFSTASAGEKRAFTKIAHQTTQEVTGAYKIAELTDTLCHLELAYLRFLPTNELLTLQSNSRYIFVWELLNTKIDEQYSGLDKVLTRQYGSKVQFRINMTEILEPLFQPYYTEGEDGLKAINTKNLPAFYKKFAKAIIDNIVLSMPHRKREFAIDLATTPCWRDFLSGHFKIQEWIASFNIEQPSVELIATSSVEVEDENTLDEEIIQLLMSHL